MKDNRKTKEQLIRELTELRQRIAELEAAEVEHERVKKALQESREAARALLNTPTDAVALIDARGIVLDVNETMAHRLRRSVDELVGLCGWDLLPPDLAETRRAYADQVIQSGHPVRFEDERQGTWYDNVLYPILNERGKVTKVAIWARDITERKQMEEELESRVKERTADLAAFEAHYRTLFESNRDGLFIINMRGRYIDVNPAACRLLGYSREELLALDVFQVGVQGRGISSEQRAQLLKRFQRIWRQGMARRETELISKSGELISVETSIAPLTYRGQEAMLGAVRDITARKRAEEELNTSRQRLRQLAQQVTSAQEEERQRLSHALHDEAGQALTALKISLQLVRDDLPAEPASLRQRLDDAVSLTDATMEGIRSLAQDLRPPALDAVGLNPTPEGFCRDFARRTQLSIDYLGTELPTLPQTSSICFYRFLQEALANVAKHACASQIAVVLRCSTDRTITLSVEDDGQGFDRQATLSDPSWPTGIGLLGIQERFESLGGWIEVETQPGQGTRLVGHMPLQKAHYEEERQ